MPPENSSAIDLLDLKMLPAWVKEETGSKRYSDFEGEREDSAGRGRRERGDFRSPRARPPGGDRRDARGGKGRREPSGRRRDSRQRDPAPGPRQPAPREEQVPLPELEVRFLPRAAAFENVAAQIKSGAAAYSVYALARLFLEKPERYDVRVSLKAEGVLYRLGESGAVSSQRAALENGAFRALRDEYYRSDVTLNEPVKGNFSSVARERTTGLLLGPTNHHNYQPQLRRLFEQRFSRRLSFSDFQRQIEMVTDPALVEQWKEDARKVTTFTTLKEETPQTFAMEAEAERHFREKYLPRLIQETREAQIDGVTSRNLRDRGIARLVEDAWATEVRSPSNMMQELTGRMRAGGLQIFRHRKGMLFVSPVRPKAIDEAGVSDSVRSILETVKATPRINRKDLADQLIGAERTPEEAEKLKLSLASDLRWLVREGHLIEFNDGSIDLPRVKSPAPESKEEQGEPSAVAQDAAPVTASSPTPEIAANHPPDPAAAVPPEPDQSPTTLSDGSTPS